MGRRYPSEPNLLIHHHPALSLSLIVAWTAAIIAIFTALCISRSKKSSLAKPSPPLPSTTTSPPSSNPIETTQQPLPPPPSMKSTQNNVIQEELVARPSPKSSKESSTNAQPHHPAASNTSMTRRKMRSSLSMKLSASFSKIRTGKEDQHKQKPRKEEDATEESLWMKTIILGERCRVPNDDDEAIVYDEKGNRISTYQPRSARSLPVSRTSSYIDPNAMPGRNL